MDMDILLSAAEKEYFYSYQSILGWNTVTPFHGQAVLW